MAFGGAEASYERGIRFERDTHGIGGGGAAPSLVEAKVVFVDGFGISGGDDWGIVGSELGTGTDTADVAAEGGGDACCAVP